ncbi:MAG: GIY-YIG nuclease family protein [Kiritimatiellales bacterium]|nr:GIY-YIG nuclease family protein [Kiritimatiellales bacterium]
MRHFFINARIRLHSPIGKNGRYYIGSTNDPERRFSQHTNDHVAATRNKGPWKRVALIEFPNATIAKKAEYHLKRQKNKRATEQAIKGIFPWPTF